MRLFTILVVTLALAGVAQASYLLAVDMNPIGAPAQAGFDAMTVLSLPANGPFVTSGGYTITLTAANDTTHAFVGTASNKQSKVPAGNTFQWNDAAYDMYRCDAVRDTLYDPYTYFGDVYSVGTPHIQIDIEGLDADTEYPLMVGTQTVYVKPLFAMVRPRGGTTGPTIHTADYPFPQVVPDNTIQGNWTTDSNGKLSVDLCYDTQAGIDWVEAGNPNHGVDTQAVLGYLVIPEPMTMSLLALGGLALIRRRK